MSDDLDRGVHEFVSSYEPDQKAIDELLDFAAAAPQHVRKRSHVLRMALLVGTAGVAALATVAVVSRGGLGPLGQGAFGTSPSASFPIIASDARYERCGGNGAEVIAAFPLVHASDFETHFPNAGQAPELESDIPAFAVVFEESPPAPILGRLIEGPMPSARSGTRDVCVWVGDAETGDGYLYRFVDISGMSTP